MLGGDANDGFEFWMSFEGMHQRCHFDGFGACTENDENFNWDPLDKPSAAIENFVVQNLLFVKFNNYHFKG